MNTKRHAANLLGPCLGILLATGCFPEPDDQPAAPEQVQSPLLLSDSPAVTVKQLIASQFYSFALKSDGTLWAWGDNSSGQLGLGDKVERHTPTQLTGISGVSHFSLGSDHVCALKTDGSLWCWGGNNYGQLGIGDLVSRSTPTVIPGITNISQILLGGTYTCAKKTDKTLWCWGGSGLLGRDWGSDTATPSQILTDVASAVLGTSNHMCATKTDGSLWCWGYNNNGEVGAGVATLYIGSPTQVTGLSNLKQVSLGENSSLALQKDGTLWAWGAGGRGELGVGYATDRFSPTKVTAASHFLQAGMGDNHACGTRSGGALWCWGDNTTGQLGLGFASDMYNTPVELTGFVGVSQLAVGSTYTCVLKTDGSVWCWGDNRWGELGLGDTTSRATPTKLTF